MPRGIAPGKVAIGWRRKEHQESESSQEGCRLDEAAQITRRLTPAINQVIGFWPHRLEKSAREKSFKRKFQKQPDRPLILTVAQQETSSALKCRAERQTFKNAAITRPLLILRGFSAYRHQCLFEAQRDKRAIAGVWCAGWG